MSMDRYWPNLGCLLGIWGFGWEAKVKENDKEDIDINYLNCIIKKIINNVSFYPLIGKY